MHRWGRAAAAVGLVSAMLAAIGISAASAGTLTAVPAPAAVTAVAAQLTDKGDRVGVAVLDLSTGATWTAGDATGLFPAESVVKILIAANLLATGRMTGQNEIEAREMIVGSDDDDADNLWEVVDGPELIDWAEQRYGITDLGRAPSTPNWWGNTEFTATGMTALIADLAHDPVVGPWLISAMGAMQATADDGTDQLFGLAAAPGVFGAAALKQGWGGDDDNFNSEELNSVGILTKGTQAVAVFVQHIPYVPMADLRPDIDDLSQAVVAGLPTPSVVSAAPTRPTAPNRPTTVPAVGSTTPPARPPTTTASTTTATASPHPSGPPTHGATSARPPGGKWPWLVAAVISLGAVVVGRTSTGGRHR